MRICFDAHIIRNSVFLMMYSMCLLKFRSYIYGDESAKSMKFPTDSSSISLSLYR